MGSIIKKVNLITWVLVLTFGSCLYGQELKVSNVFGDHMVLQRDKLVPVWGFSAPNDKVTVTFAGQIKTCKADNTGKWMIQLDSLKASSFGREMVISGNSKIVIKDILVGEVWLCSGQSNMYQPMKGYVGQPTMGTLEALKRANNNKLRLFHVGKKGAGNIQDTLLVQSGWKLANAQNILTYSAIAYYFGKELQEVINVPVGMIHSSWGGSKIQAWMSNESITQFEEVNLEGKDLTKQTNAKPTLLYNAMIHPLIPYAIRGALWYQGESNRKEPEKYKKYFPAMVKDWRERWQDGEFPFYYVQIAPFHYFSEADSIYNNSNNSAFIREVQQKCLELIPNSGMAVTMDIGEKYNIHPSNKKQVADRLLYNALHKTYGLRSFNTDGPIYESMNVRNDSIILKFKNTPDGLYAFDELSGFEIAGEDRVFYPAEAKIVNYRKNILVKSESVNKPVAVRYCWRNWSEGTLFNTYLLPASSFRTDNWDNAERFTIKEIK